MQHKFIATGFNTGMFGRTLSNSYYRFQRDDVSAILMTKLDTVLTSTNSVKSVAESAQQTATSAQLAAKSASDAVEELKKTAKVISDQQAEMQKNAEANQKALDQLLIEAKNARAGGGTTDNSKNFKSEFAEIIRRDIDKIRDQASAGSKYTTRMSGGAEMIQKAAGAVMTTATDLTGNPVITFVPQPILLPGQKVNVRDLVTTFQSSTANISIFRENSPTPAVGSFGQQLTEGAQKAQVEYQYTTVNFVAYYVQGFVRFAKQMLYNLPWLQTALPQQLMRDFYIKENQIFSNALFAAATGPTATNDAVTGLGSASYAARLIQVIAGLEGTNFTPNGIVVSPKTWASLMLTIVPSFGGATPLGTSYNVPGGVQITADGKMSIAGYPIIKANWITDPMAMVGDWDMASIAQVENLKIEFFEQDSDNVEKNLITARCEAFEVFITDQPLAFSYKNLNSAS